MTMKNDCIGIAKRDIKAGETITIELNLGSDGEPYSEDIEVLMTKHEIVGMCGCDGFTIPVIGETQ